MKVSKKNDLKFRTACILLVLCENAFAINETLRNGNYRIEGEKNSLEVVFYDNSGSGFYSVFCRFDKCNELSGYMNSKHNFYSSSDMNAAVKEFELFLKDAVKHL